MQGERELTSNSYIIVGGGEQGHLDPTVKECLDALDDEDYIDEDIEDDFVVKLNRDDVAVLCPINAAPHLGSRLGRLGRTPGNGARNQNGSGTDSDGEDSLSDVASLKGLSYATSLAITHIDNKFDAIMRIYDSDEEDDDLDEVGLEELSSGSDDSEEGDDGDDDSGDEQAAGDFCNEQEIQEALDDFLLNQRDYIRSTTEDRRRDAMSFLDAIRQEMGVPSAAVLDRQDGEGEEELLLLSSSSDGDHYDCQSIALTLSHTDNLPAVIKEESRCNRKARTDPSSGVIRLSRRTGLPIMEGPLSGQPVLLGKDDGSEDEDAVQENKGQPRPRGETAEEKKARKAAIKEERREKRAQKKDLKVRFKLGEVIEHPHRR